MLNKVKESVHFQEIEERILKGQSDRSISNWLKEECGESIHYRTIYNYRKEFLNIDEEASKAYNEKQRREMLQPYIDKRVNDIEFCDIIMNAAAKLNLKVDKEDKISVLDIYKIGLQAVKIKHDITKDSPSKTIDHNIIIPDDPEARAKGRAAIELIRLDTND